MDKKTSLGRAITLFSPAEIKALFLNARTVLKEKGLELRRATTTHPHGRILIVVPKKVGSAPERNLIRRRIKAIFYQEKLYQQIVDTIIFVSRNATNLSYQELKVLLKKEFEHGG